MPQKLLRLLLLMLVISCEASQAQSWQWGKAVSCDSGLLSSWYLAYGASSSANGLIDMTTDEAGNVYSLLFVTSGHLKMDGQTINTYGGTDVLLSSFSCEGRYRWSKLIGSSSDSDVALSVKASCESGVFVAGQMSLVGPGGSHFGNDTSLAGMNKTMFIAKWDTAGNFQWLRLPQPTIMSHDSAWSYSRLADMDLARDGTIYLLACLSPGVYEGGYSVSTLGAHVLKYSSNGQFLGGLALPITSATPYSSQYINKLCSSSIRYDGTNSQFIVTGGAAALGATTINGITLGDAVSLVSSFNAGTGAVAWLKASNPVRQVPYLTSQVTIYSGPQLDAQGNVYVTGHANDSGVFNGVLFRNPQHTRIGVDFVMKLDAATGNAVWTTVSRGAYSSNGTTISDLALTGQKLAVTGYYQDSLIFPNALLTNAPSDNIDAFIVQLDAATGAVQKMASLTGTSRTGGGLITADRRGNFYVTGSYGLAAQAIGPDALTIDNYYNFFIAKWGWANCSCTPPVASLVHSASSNLAQAYTYTGTTSGLDSLVWDFGDGTTQKITSGFGNAVLHNFATIGHYTVCVTAYNESCGGSSTACIPLALSVGTALLPGNIRVYPNPVSQELNIEGAAQATAAIYDMLGRQVMQVPILGDRQVLKLGAWPTGLYLLRLSDHEGHSQNIRFSKQ